MITTALLQVGLANSAVERPVRGIADPAESLLVLPVDTAWGTEVHSASALTDAFARPVEASASAGGAWAPWALSASAAAIRTRVLSLLAECSVDEGLGHPVDRVVRATIMRHDGGEVIQALLLGSYYYPEVLSSLIRSLSRSGPVDALWSEALVIAGLRHASVEVRETTVGLIEAWGTPGFVAVLRRHREPTGWLRNYIERVITELGGQ